MTLTIAPLAEHELDALCALAREIWREYYPPIIGAAQTEYMLAQRYDPAIVRDELARGDVWWDVLREDEALVAFASSMRDADRALKLDKLYVHAAQRRRGYGAALIEHACDRARRLGCERVVLAVNKANAQAIAAYRGCGFDIVAEAVKDIGGGFVMDDFIMEKRLTSPRRERGQGEGE